MKNRTNLFLDRYGMGSGPSFVSKKLKEQGFVRKSHPKNALWNWIRDPEKIYPGSQIQGVKSTGSRIRIRNTDKELAPVGFFSSLMLWRIRCEKVLDPVRDPE
jgi:hypothetical protein